MEKITLYFALEQSTLVAARKVHIGDIATIYCRNMDIYHKISKSEILTMPDKEQSQIVITAMKLISLISGEFEKIHVESRGSPETIVYYKNLKAGTKAKGKLKALFLILIAFLGTAYSIMSYNGDVGTADLLSNIYNIFTGKEGDIGDIGYAAGVFAYSIGLTLGMIIFFNHGINKCNTDDPTPLQVQMRLYEQDVNNCIILDSNREKKTIDAD